MIQKFECSYTPEQGCIQEHHDTYTRQKQFLKDVQAFCSALDEVGNPFKENTSTDLHFLDSKVFLNEKVVNELNAVEHIGQVQLNDLLHKT